MYRIWAIVLLLSTEPVLAQQATASAGLPVCEQLCQEMRAANPTGLARWLASEVAISVEGEKSPYPKDQAAIVLEDLYRRLNLHGFEKVHSASGNPDGQVLIGRFQSSQGPTRVRVLFQKSEGRLAIAQLDFMKE